MCLIFARRHRAWPAFRTRPVVLCDTRSCVAGSVSRSRFRRSNFGWPRASFTNYLGHEIVNRGSYAECCVCPRFFCSFSTLLPAWRITATRNRAFPANRSQLSHAPKYSPVCQKPRCPNLSPLCAPQFRHAALPNHAFRSGRSSAGPWSRLSR